MIEGDRIVVSVNTRPVLGRYVRPSEPIRGRACSWIEVPGGKSTGLRLEYDDNIQAVS